MAKKKFHALFPALPWPTRRDGTSHLLFDKLRRRSIIMRRRRKEKERRVRENVEKTGCEQVDIADLFVLIERFVCWEASN